MITPEAWPALDLWQQAGPLVRSGDIIVDRPVGSAHPTVPGLVYPLGYSYAAGTAILDGQSVDAWSGSGTAELVTAVARTIDPCKKNAELKDWNHKEVLSAGNDGVPQTSCVSWRAA